IFRNHGDARLGISSPGRGSTLQTREISEFTFAPGEEAMPIIRREFIRLSGVALVAPPIANIAFAQTQAGPKFTQILRNALEGQGQVSQEMVGSLAESHVGRPS